jgi:two-component system sensor histidine kinase AtoS
MARAAEDHRRALEAAEAMRHAEARAVLAETATSMSRLAAALSHELNTPLGVLKSSVETLVRAVNRSRPVNEPGRFPEVVEELRSSIIASIDRLSGIVSRLQRITNLDRAEVQPIQLGQHLNDVVATLATDKDIRVELPELPAVVCRPQVLSAIFSILLHNCVSRQVFVRAGAAANSLLLRIEQPGHVIPEATLDELFDPAFRVVDGRMATGNWGLFSARQVMRELGGDVTADSNESSGTVFTVIIPRECQP